MSADTPRGRMRRRLDNALRLLRQGGVTAPYRAQFEVVLRDPVVQLRRYRTPVGVDARAATVGESAPAVRPVLLVPPLMVTSEIYDISPELSAVAYLAGHGVPTHVADFGPPESQEGGLDRTLDDHVLAVSRCIDHLRETYGHDVHLVGYSQGGMFCYQTAAYRRSEGVASLVTFGSPVDIRKNVPFSLDRRLADPLIAATRRLVAGPLERLRGLPGTMSSRGFKLLAPLQELRHLVQLFAALHDEEALARIEPKRRFLGGEGFIAWPGPALRAFIDQFVVENRMKTGGFVIAGRTTSLAEITSPICFVVGESDDLALPDAVRAITTAAPRAHAYPVHVDAGHFGLVVGRAAMQVCWPTVVAWIAWLDGRGLRPAILDSAREHSASEPRPDSLLSSAAEGLWDRMDRVGQLLGRTAEAARWRLPRLMRSSLLDLADAARLDQHLSLSRTLGERARDMPDAVAFVFAGRAFTFADADQRVSVIARALVATGVGVGTRVAVIARAHPDALSVIVALNRLGAVALLVAPDALAERMRASLPALLSSLDAALLVIERADLPALDPAPLDHPLALIGRAPEVALPPRSFDLEPASAHTPAAGEVPLVDPGRADDPAIALSGLEAGALDNRAWIRRGLELGATARLTPQDTLFCPPTLSPVGLISALAGALMNGARLQLGQHRATDAGPEASGPWGEILNSGATILFADDELARALADAPLPQRHPVRLVFGDSLASEVAQGLVDRLGPRTRFRTL